MALIVRGKKDTVALNKKSLNLKVFLSCIWKIFEKECLRECLKELKEFGDLKVFNYFVAN